ncbi:MAG: hypothetical protein ACYCU8_06555, partial [Ferrimicrobium acidiphilum]
NEHEGTCHYERGCCSPECLLAWERYRIGEVCRQYPFMDEIVERHDLARALEFLTTLLNCRVTIDRGPGWTVTADTVWLSPDWEWFGSDAAHIFDSIAGFSITDTENVGLRYAHFSALEEDPFNATLALIADVTRWRGSCIKDCDAWVAAHIGEIEVQAGSAFAHDRLTFDALDELHEWIYTLAIVHTS